MNIFKKLINKLVRKLQYEQESWRLSMEELDRVFAESAASQEHAMDKLFNGRKPPRERDRHPYADAPSEQEECPRCGQTAFALPLHDALKYHLGYCQGTQEAEKETEVTVDHPQYGTRCEICFDQLTLERCATDTNGQKWDVCTGDCARQAGIEEVPSKL